MQRPFGFTDLAAHGDGHHIEPQQAIEPVGGNVREKPSAATLAEDRGHGVRIIGYLDQRTTRLFPGLRDDLASREQLLQSVG